MRISEDLRKIVVFLGFEDTKENIKCIGTGFLVFYKETGYLVTARHVAMALDDVPFMIRVNCKNGSSTNIFEDHIKWFCHPDDDVDIAIIPYDKLYNKSLYDVLYMPLPEWSKPISGEFIDIGDICYTIGLFRLLKGEKRNLPVVHSGNISLLPRDEKIPVSDWHEQQKTKYIEAYLVESQSLDGLSGAPVFARPTINYMLSPETDNDSLQKRRPSLGRPVYTSVGSENLYFLGIWHGSWNAPPDEITQVTMGISGAVRVSLGMGIVVPAKKLIELLEVPEVLKNRNNILARESVAYAASQDKVVIDNSQHKEDFISLVSEAVKGIITETCYKAEGEPLKVLRREFTPDEMAGIMGALKSWLSEFGTQGTMESKSEQGIPYTTVAIGFTADRLEEAVTMFKHSIQELRQGCMGVSVRWWPEMIEHENIYALRCRVAPIVE